MNLVRNLIDTNQAPHILTAAVARLSLTTNLSTVTSVVAETARALTGADGTTFVLREGDKCYYADEDAISPLWKGSRFPMEACISGWAMINRQVVVIPDIYEDARIPHDAYRPTFVKSLCMVPVGFNPVAAIGAYWSDGRIPSTEDVRVLQILANSTAIALENLQLKQEMLASNTTREDLQGRAEELEVALHVMAHDLRTPISAMTGIAELLRIHLRNSPDSKLNDYVKTILETGRQTAEQIERMLVLYKATKGTVVKQKIDLSAIAGDIVALFRPQILNRDIEFEIDPDMTAHGDPSLIRMVLENLLSNAVKYSSKKKNAQIRIGFRHRDGLFAVFYVRDNGDGFDQTLSSKLFKPLGRLHQSGDFIGTGLGLSSVAKIVELHGGKVSAEGKRDQGATFYFSLPVL